MTGHDVILHPTDGTATSEAALEEATMLADRLDARIQVVSVVDVTAFPGSPSQAAIHRVESAAQSAVDRAVEQVEEAGVPVSASVEFGAAVSTIVRRCGGDAEDVAVEGAEVAVDAAGEVADPIDTTDGPDGAGEGDGRAGSDDPAPVGPETGTDADHTPADMVVMGTHGRTGVQHFLVGSVAEHTIRESPVPVVVVPGPE